MAIFFNDRGFATTVVEVVEETVKAGTPVQEELKSAILLRCVGGQLKSYLNLTMGNVLCSMQT